MNLTNEQKEKMWEELYESARLERGEKSSSEKTIEEFSGEFNRTELWKKLPKKVMWQTFLVILEYLESINKIAFDKESKIAYIWNPELAKKLRARKEIKI